MADALSRYNATAWDAKVDEGWEWTIPVSKEEVDVARGGKVTVFLTPDKPVPDAWLQNLKGKKILGLACGGGQQCPLFAAAGAVVTVFDNSPKQLEQDRKVAARDGLDMTFELGDMRDLSRFDDGVFDMVFHPVSNTYVDRVLPVWQEAFRVLRHSGSLLAGFPNPLIYLFDENSKDLSVTHRLPYSDRDDLQEDVLQKRLNTKTPLEFSHTLTAQIGGQLEAGFVLTGFYEDNDPSGENAIDAYTTTYIATKAVKI